LHEILEKIQMQLVYQYLNYILTTSTAMLSAEIRILMLVACNGLELIGSPGTLSHSSTTRRLDLGRLKTQIKILQFSATILD
jgi:hypothetical protein